jgi:hypothetical protein
VIQYSPLCRIDRLSRSQGPHIWRERERRREGGERERRREGWGDREEKGRVGKERGEEKGGERERRER